MKTYTKIVLVFLSVVLSPTINAQTQIEQPHILDSLQNKVLKLMRYYESYEDGSPDSLKKALYKSAVIEVSEGAASQKDIDQSYEVVDAYIKADKALERDNGKVIEEGESFEEHVKKSKEYKESVLLMKNQHSLLMNMSYPEFESSVLAISPATSKKEIKQAYNEMHQSDGKQVALSEEDEEMTEMQKQMWAIETLNNPKNFEEFKKAYKVLKPNARDAEIKEAWEKYGPK